MTPGFNLSGSSGFSSLPFFDIAALGQEALP